MCVIIGTFFTHQLIGIATPTFCGKWLDGCSKCVCCSGSNYLYIYISRSETYNGKQDKREV
jgi:hypothetical protein